MPGQHIHDGGLTIRRGTAARSHFIKVEADDLSVAEVELRGFLQDDIGVDGIQKGTPDIEDEIFVIGVLDAFVLPDLRADIRQQRHGVALGLQGFMDIAPFKQSIDHFPPGRGSVPAYAFFRDEGVQLRKHVRLVKPGVMVVGEFLIGEINRSAYESGNTVGRSRDIQRRGQQRQQIDQKCLVRRQRFSVAQRRVKGINGIVRRHSEPVIGREMFAAFRQIFLQQRYQPRAGRTDIHDG